MIIYNIDGVDYIHIQKFVDLIDRSQQSTRRLIRDGNTSRRLKALRDRSRLLIAITEIVGYPFVNHGRQVAGHDIYHYVPYDLNDQKVNVCKEDGSLDIEKLKAVLVDDTIEWRREFCELCTYTLEHCKLRQAADAVVIEREVIE